MNRQTTWNENIGRPAHVYNIAGCIFFNCRSENEKSLI